MTAEDKPDVTDLIRTVLENCLGEMVIDLVVIARTSSAEMMAGQESGFRVMYDGDAFAILGLSTAAQNHFKSRISEEF